MPGVEARVLLDVDGIRVGLIGLRRPTGVSSTRRRSASTCPTKCRSCVSTPTFSGPREPTSSSCCPIGLDRDRDLAAELDGEITLVIGSHSHTLLLEGEQVGRVTIVQAGEFGTYLGRVELAVAPDGAAS